MTTADKNKIILPDEKKAPVHTGNILLWIWYFLSPYKKTVISFSLFRLFRYTYLSLFPIAVGIVIDALEQGTIQENPEPYFIGMTIYMVIFALLLFNIVFIPEMRQYEKSIRALTIFSVNHINKLSLDWHEKQGSGGKLQRIMTARTGVQELLRFYRWDLFPFIGDMTAITISLFILEIPFYYFFLFLGFASTYIWASWFFSRPFLNLFNRYHEKFEKLLSGVYEFVSSMRTVKSYHLQPYVSRNAHVLEGEGQKAIVNAFKTNLKRWTICNFIASFWLGVFFILGLYLVLQEEMTIGSYSTSVLFAAYLWGVCEYIGSFIEKIYEHGNAVNRLVKTLRVKPKQFDLTPAQTIDSNWKEIQFKNLSYTYDEEGNHGVKQIDFTAQRGQKIALVGNSGAGKSTFIKLLMKHMLPEKGKILIGESNISYVPTSDWLAQISYVPQDIELFNLSTRDNILLDKQDIDPAALDHALEQSALAEFIKTLPRGLDTAVGECGVKLSGGQRQRLGIARALVRQAPIIIFDEATSALDSISESKIQKAIENSFEGRTAFIIAHRLSTIRNADHIIVMDEGEIIEQGDFNTLIKLNQHFAKLWNMQSR